MLKIDIKKRKEAVKKNVCPNSWMIIKIRIEEKKDQAVPERKTKQVRYHRIRKANRIKRIFHHRQYHDRYRGIVHCVDWKQIYHRKVARDSIQPGNHSEVQLVEHTNNYEQDMCYIEVR